MSSMTDDTAAGPAPQGGPAAVPRAQRGRPRSAAAERAILDATLALIAEHGNIGALSIEAVAQAAGCGKATIYRRWSNKEALVIAAVEAAEEPIPELAGESVRDDLVALLVAMRRNLLDQRAEGLLQSVLGHVKQHPELARRYHEVVIEKRREAMRVVLRRGVATGELRADLPIEVMKDLFSAPMLVRKMMHDAQDLPPELPEQIVDSVLTGLAVPEAARPPRDADGPEM
ncbi:TetR/AcrR family transcriptional regulator [Yinghuangia seranimata]|uniref:TetR/AcrR family transcriptional regulator n=1 Tax=Yinghuangia seranimata TaxID=408067 RepID=UPI00248C0BA8|nr:TetR/AcrR family transcriptional regulator [Yinghuangia seranimata]MDI2132381.1 TetR/AcrR family transcriptional regulator [Yinghuangia seranimata]